MKAYRFGGEEFCVLVNEISVVEVNRRIKNFVKELKHILIELSKDKVS